MKYQIIDFMTVLLMADQNKLKPYLYIIPCINSYINFDIKNQKLFMFCYKCTEFILNVFWCVGLWWSWVAGTTAQLAQRRISECVGGWVAVAGWCQPGPGTGCRVHTPVHYSQLTQSFQTTAPPLPAAAGTTQKNRKNVHNEHWYRGCAVYSVVNNRGTGSGPPQGTMRH